jgi:hypothetical protein
MSSTNLRSLGLSVAILATAAGLPPSHAGTDSNKQGPSAQAQNADGESNKGNGGVIVDKRKIKAPGDAQVILEPDTANGGSNIGNGGTTGRGNANGGSNNGNGGVVIDRRTIERQAARTGKGTEGDEAQGGKGTPAGRTITLPWGGKVFVPGLHADGDSNVGNGQDGTVIGKGTAKGGKNNGRDGIGLNGGSAKGGSGNGNGGVVIDGRKVKGASESKDDNDD